MANITSDKDWEARSDFHSLSQAEEIKSDKKRYSKALKAGRSVLKDREDDIKAMKKVASKKPAKKSAPKKSTKKRK